MLLQATVAAGLNSKAIKPTHLKRITVDTTVQEKAVSFPTDSKLLNRSRVRLVICVVSTVWCCGKVTCVKDRRLYSRPIVMVMPGRCGACVLG